MSLNNEEIIDDEEKVESDSAVNDDHETDDIPNDSQPVKDEVVMGSGAAIIKKPDHVTPVTNFTSRVLFAGRSRCNHCKGNSKQPPMHCRVKDGIFNDTCSNRHCDCRCRTYTLNAQGKLAKINFGQQEMQQYG